MFPSFEQILSLIHQSKSPVYITGAIGSSRAFLLSEINKSTGKNLLIITDTQRRSYELYDELSFFLNGKRISLLPHWGTLPYRPVNPSQDVMSQRINSLAELACGELPDVLVTPVRGFIQKVLPPEDLRNYIMEIFTGQEIERDKLIRFLATAGFKNSPLVEALGEFSVHGGIVDIYSPSNQYPVRIEFDGDRIYSMRLFDPESQRKIKDTKRIKIIPPSEIIFSDKNLSTGIQKLKEVADSKGIPKQIRKSLEEKFLKDEDFPGKDFYYPYFNSLIPCYEYFPQNLMLVIDNDLLCQNEMEKFTNEVFHLYTNREDKDKLYPSPEMLFLTKVEFENFLSRNAFIVFSSAPNIERKTIHIPSESCEDLRNLISPARELPFQDLADKLCEWLEEGNRIFIVMPNEIEIKRIITILSRYKIKVVLSERKFSDELVEPDEAMKIVVLKGGLRKGFRIKDDKFLLIGEWDLFGEKRKIKHIPKIKGIEITDFGMLKEGDLVVHNDYGIGRYLGLKLIERDGSKTEFLVIEYRDGDRLYVPIFRLNQIQKYRGPKETAPELHKLGTTRWEKEKRRAKQSIRELTANLLRLYARRKLVRGYSFPPADYIYKEFESTFPYEETPDQEKAINDVIADMEKDTPMDRLICGDVGFGKTEVAIRATFKADMAGKQVAILTPTTILSIQHYKTFTDRFHNYPIRVELLNRLKKTREIQRILEDTRNGKVDVLIGTHRLLMDDVVFKDIGLLIIDEEHRFGVLQKEKIKKLKEGIDVISMTATPIPRSLQMSLSGIRDMSVIYTPPLERQSIKTFVSYMDEEIIKDAIVLEKVRGGQTFYIHNEIKDISKVAEYLNKLVPEVRIKIAHGRLNKKELERTMIEFLNKEIDLLVSTSIIASGIDIPTANTIIVERAHKFGLTDLYQLRGRVGRSRETAYAYFLIPSDEPISEDALKRLSAIQEYAELGAGFKLAMRDLEIRGSGELLGARQSGHIFSLGFDLYSRLLEETIREMSGKEVEEEIDPEINGAVEAYIPEEYIPDIRTRLEIYKKISIAREDPELNDLMDEMTDRFGKIPPPVLNMFELTKLRNLLSKHRIPSLNIMDSSVIINLALVPETKLVPFFNKINTAGFKYRFDKRKKLILEFNSPMNLTQINLSLKKILDMLK